MKKGRDLQSKSVTVSSKTFQPYKISPTFAALLQINHRAERCYTNLNFSHRAFGPGPRETPLDLLLNCSALFNGNFSQS